MEQELVKESQLWAGACATDRKSFKMEEEWKRSRHGTELSKFRGPKMKPPELKSNKEDMRGDTSYTIKQVSDGCHGHLLS